MIDDIAMNTKKISHLQKERHFRLLLIKSRSARIHSRSILLEIEVNFMTWGLLGPNRYWARIVVKNVLEYARKV